MAPKRKPTYHRASDGKPITSLPLQDQIVAYKELEEQFAASEKRCDLEKKYVQKARYRERFEDVQRLRTNAQRNRLRKMAANNVGTNNGNAENVPPNITTKVSTPPPPPPRSSLPVLAPSIANRYNVPNDQEFAELDREGQETVSQQVQDAIDEEETMALLRQLTVQEGEAQKQAGQAQENRTNLIQMLKDRPQRVESIRSGIRSARKESASRTASKKRSARN